MTTLAVLWRRQQVRRHHISCCLVVAALSIGSLAVLAPPAGAQTGNLTAFCDARLRADDEQGKKKTLAALNDMVGTAPAPVQQPMTDLRDLYKKKGGQAFESKKGAALLA